MKLLLDENLSPELVRRLHDIFPGSAHVHFCDLGAVDDALVWEYARLHGFVVVTKDQDYNDRSSLYGYPPKIIWLRIGNCSTAMVEKLLRDNSILIHDFETDGNAVIVLR